MASNYYLCKPTPILFNHHSWGFFEREWIGYPLVRDVSLSNFRRVHDYLEFAQIPEETEIG